MLRRLWKHLQSDDVDWTRSLGAVVAAVGFLWGAWVFVFQEILRPAVAPVNISLELDVTRLSPTIGSVQPVRLKVSARNASNKVLTIRKTFWVGHAIQLKRGPSGTLLPLHEEKEIIRDINRRMSQKEESVSLEGGAASRYTASSEEWDVIGFGPLFDVSKIRPNEEIRSQRIILVPQVQSASYDLLRVNVYIPSFAKNSALTGEEDLIRVEGGIWSPNSKDIVNVGFCEAERGWRRHGLRWFFDKFALPRDDPEAQVFTDSGSRHCPNLMSLDQEERIGAQVFRAVYEIPLFVPSEDKG